MKKISTSQELFKMDTYNDVQWKSRQMTISCRDTKTTWQIYSYYTLIANLTYNPYHKRFYLYVYGDGYTTLKNDRIQHLYSQTTTKQLNMFANEIDAKYTMIDNS